MERPWKSWPGWLPIRLVGCAMLASCFPAGASARGNGALASPPIVPPAPTAARPQPSEKKPVAPEQLPTPKKTAVDVPILPAFDPKEAFASCAEVLAIDLPTAFRLANADNPTIGLARARIDEAYARLEQAQLLWLPNLEASSTYLRHDGEIQNATGLVFSTNKGAISVLGGAGMQVQTADALFAPLIARRLVEAQTASTQAVTNQVLLDVALAYLDLLQSYGQLAVNADLLARDQEVLRRTEQADKNELAKTGADITRARTEVALRLTERTDLRGRVRVASSHLARLLLLKPTVALVPAEPAIVPVMLVPEDGCADDLIATGLMTRPELAEGRALVAAGLARLRQSRLSPLLPRLDVTYYAGGFGGGLNSRIGDFKGRGDGVASAVWEVRNLGLGNLAENRARQAQVSEANYHVLEVQAQVADEVNAAIQIARARREALDNAQVAVRQAIEMFRRLDLISFGMTGPKKELETLEPLLAIQQLAQARTQYLSTVIEYNRAQFHLFAAMGRPSSEALTQAVVAPLSVPTVPAPFTPPKLK